VAEFYKLLFIFCNKQRVECGVVFETNTEENIWT